MIYQIPIIMHRESRSDCLEFLDQFLKTAAEGFTLDIALSRCGECGHSISSVEGMQTADHPALRSKSKDSQTSIFIKYPLIELLTGVISLQALDRWLIFNCCLIALVVSIKAKNFPG